MFKSAVYPCNNRIHLNKNVLSDFLKISSEGLFLISTGRVFHSFGPHTKKLLSPNLLQDLGTCKSSRLLERRHCLGSEF